MRILVVGGAGHVASIVRPALEAAHEVTYFDRVQVLPIAENPKARGRKPRTIIGDVLDDDAVSRAVRGQQAIVYLAMGGDRNVNRSNPLRGFNTPELAFRVNVAGWYQFSRLALAAGARHLTYASSVSVYSTEIPTGYIRDECDPPDAFYPYGFSKRCGEFVCAGAAQANPKAAVVCLRLYLPSNQADFDLALKTPRGTQPLLHLGPNDTSRLFLAALRLRKPGLHTIHATGDLKQLRYNQGCARRLLKWAPRGE